MTERRTPSLRLAAVVAPLLALLAAVLPAHARDALASHSNSVAPLVAVRHGTFTLAGRPLPYLHGINYEGPSDRPWRMWQDNLFNPALIARDFDAIAAAGYNPVRIFIQHPLPSMILDGDFSRLDTVVSLAAARGLRLLITFNDDGDPDLRRVTRVESLVAAHLAGNPAVFGYDLRNEPNLIDVAASSYPAGTTLPLLSHALIAAYHERVSMAAARAAQHSSAWSSGPFGAFDTRTLYYYLNALHLLNSFMRDNPGYPVVAATLYWTRFLDLANRTLADYIGVQVAAIRAADPSHLITVGYNSRFWSALPANRTLDFRSIHLYPPADFGGFHESLRFFEALNALAPTPLVLEEYGVSNDRTGRQASAVREMAAALYLRTLGGGGDMKWMFDDDAVGYNAYENNLGAVDTLGRPKPTYLASAAADAYWAHTPYKGGLILQPDPISGAGFVYVARDGMAIGGSQPYADARLSYTPRGPGVLWLDWSTPGRLRVTPTSDGTLTVALGALTGATALLAIPTPAAPTPTETPLPTLTPALPAGTATPAFATGTGTVTPDFATKTATSTPVLQMSLPTPTGTPVAVVPTATASVTGPLTLAAAYTHTPVVTHAIAPLAGGVHALTSTGDQRPGTAGFQPVPRRLPGSAGVPPLPALPGRAGRPRSQDGFAQPTPTATVLPVAPLTSTIPPVAATATPAATAPPVVTNGLTVTLSLRAGVPQTVLYRAGLLPRVPIDLPAPSLSTGWYMVARGHNVAAPFLAPWLSLGGAEGIGLPLTEAFAYHGLPTQYFDDVALRIGPHGLTTAPIGVVALNGARPRAKELPKRIPHLYDRFTGHNIHGFFLDFWRRHGGLAFWGDPLTEEIREHGRLVQYFSGAGFVLHEGPHAYVGLLPLGARMWPSVRHVYGQ